MGSVTTKESSTPVGDAWNRYCAVYRELFNGEPCLSPAAIIEFAGRERASVVSETREQEPSGYAVVTKEGAFVGIWRARDTAESIVNRSQGSAAGERIVPMFEALPSATREKFIRCVWVVEREWGYGMAMRVVDSDHPRFAVGTRFDFGFLTIAVTEGYRIQIEDVPPHVKHDMEEARRERQRTER